MSKSKKELDRDMMFQKILPTLADNPFTVDKETTPVLAPQEEDQLSALQSKLFSHPETATYEETFSITNVMESLVLRHISQVIQKFNCCRCDRCRQDIAAYALNLLPPKYMVADSSKMEEIEQEISSKQIMNALIKAVIQIRANPRH